MAFPERDHWRAAAARKERVWGEKILTLSFLAGDLAPEMPYGDDCGAEEARLELAELKIAKLACVDLRSCRRPFTDIT